MPCFVLLCPEQNVIVSCKIDYSIIEEDDACSWESPLKVLRFIDAYEFTDEHLD